MNNQLQLKQKDKRLNNICQMMKENYEERITELSNLMNSSVSKQYQAQKLELSSVYCFLWTQSKDIISRTIFYQVYEVTLKRLSP